MAKKTYIGSDYICAGEGCICPIGLATAVELRGRRFCSQACATGRGCEHRGCGCA